MSGSRRARILGFGAGWLVLITVLHLSLNMDWAAFLNEYLEPEDRKLVVGFIPVTCHLACPVTDYISKHTADGTVLIPRMFQGFPEIKEALISGKMQAGFLVAPLAVALVSQGIPIKIVYLGHRYGSAVVVQKDGPVHSVEDLRGKTIAIPSRFSDERLLVLRALKQHGMSFDDVKLVEMSPPDVSGALAVKAIDGFSMGEPFPSQAEMGGWGRVLFHAREYWPDYMSCVLVVREDVIEHQTQAVQVMVDGIARSGLWLDEGRPHREYAADFVGRFYYNQAPRLLRWALTNPLDRVWYEPLTPRKADFELVQNLMVETGILDADKVMPFERFVDIRFAEGAMAETAWTFEPGDDTAR